MGVRSVPHRPSGPRAQPVDGTLRGRPVTLFDGTKPIDDCRGVDQFRVEEGTDKVLILLAEGAQLRNAEILLVETPAGELRLAGRCSGVGVLDLHQPDPTTI